MVKVPFSLLRYTMISPICICALSRMPLMNTRSPSFNAGHIEPEVIVAIGYGVSRYHERNFGIPTVILAMIAMYMTTLMTARNALRFFFGTSSEEMITVSFSIIIKLQPECRDLK